ncbi:MAG: tRNA glutamyl-Q(34) synthetase GluQRS [Panacagrimonas sp.]
MPSCAGRFAPTPSGPLHLGSLVTALGSYLCARAANGLWFLRLDDLDRPRVVVGSEAIILRQLEEHGLHWDGAPRRQSEHIEEYAAAVEQLQKKGRVYACRCTRSELRPTAVDSEPIYPGHCRSAAHPDAEASLRFRVPAGLSILADPVLGRLERRLDVDLGDFIVRRRDGLFAYQLASAIDEMALGITDVVRGADLVDSSFRQKALLESLGADVPKFWHLPLIVGSTGEKLSKRDGAAHIRTDRATANLIKALGCLGQKTAPLSAGCRVDELLQHAIATWDPEKIPSRPQVLT